MIRLWQVNELEEEEQEYSAYCHTPEEEEEEFFIATEKSYGGAEEDLRLFSDNILTRTNQNIAAIIEQVRECSKFGWLNVGLN